jgi:Recombination endonuclease VII
MPKRGESLVVDGKKQCLGCEAWLDVEANFKRMDRPNRPGEAYYFPRCHPCLKKYHREYYQGRKAEDPNYARAVSRRSTLRKYGLTPEQYDAMVTEQDGKCAVCGKEPGITEGVDRFNLVVDHDHDCCGEGKACDNCRRSLLCDFCNRGLGIFRDDPDLLIAAAAYLLQHRGGG